MPPGLTEVCVVVRWTCRAVAKRAQCRIAQPAVSSYSLRKKYARPGICVPGQVELNFVGWSDTVKGKTRAYAAADPRRSSQLPSRTRKDQHRPGREMSGWSERDPTGTRTLVPTCFSPPSASGHPFKQRALQGSRTYQRCPGERDTSRRTLGKDSKVSARHAGNSCDHSC